MDQNQHFLFIAILSLLLGSCSGAQNQGRKTVGERGKVFLIPMGENTWSTDRSIPSSIITQEGIMGWTDLHQSLRSYFRTDSSGAVQLRLRLRVPEGSSRLKIHFAGETRELEISNAEFEDVLLGNFEIAQAGYQILEIEPVSKSAQVIAEIETLLVGGPATHGGVNFVEDNFHFGRRGPSVHLRYHYPKDRDVLYFYTEMEVPQGEDVIGSFFMANGFSHGYFGIQVNSQEERRILFSVWSPYDTRDPKEIPEDYRISLLNKGEGVHSGEFGNEGSGGQSFKKYMWKPDTTYKFLLKGEPAGDNHTDYTAYFYAPEKGEWELIASFRRPYTDRYLGNLHSFLENFVPSAGNISRKAYYKNQWVHDTDGRWVEATSATFTADATAKAGDRLDYAGGVENNVFFMQNGGFFNQYTGMDSKFEREPSRQAPEIDFEHLPK